MSKYFVYCSESGYWEYDTEQEAQEEAQRRIDLEREYAIKGWSDNVETITWGKVLCITQQVNIKTKDEAAEEDIFVGDFGYCDYILKEDDL